MPRFPNIGNDFARKYFEVVSTNRNLRQQIEERGQSVGKTGIGVTTVATIPKQIPLETYTALATYNPEVYGGILVQQFPQNFEIIQSAEALRLSASSAATIDRFKNFEIQKGDFSNLTAIQRRPGLYNPTIPGSGFNARRAIIAGLDPKTREILRQLEDLKILNDLVKKFLNYANQLELIIQAAANFISSYLTNPLLRGELELQVAIAKLQEAEDKYRKAKRLISLLVRAYRATKTAIIKALFTDGPKAVESVKKGYATLQKVLNLPEIPRIRLVLKWPRFPRIWLTIVDFFARFRKLIDALKKKYVKVYKAMYVAAIKQSGFEILDPNDKVLQAFSTAKNALREARGNIQAVRNTIERGIADAENQLKNNIRSTAKNVLDEQARILTRYNNLKLSGSRVEARANITALDATRALRGTAGEILGGIDLFNQVVTDFGGSTKSLINTPLLGEVQKVLSIGTQFENQYGVKPANPVNNTQVVGDTVIATATALDATTAISKASAENRKKARELGYSEAKTFSQDLQNIEVNGQTQWKVTVTGNWVYDVNGFKFDSTIGLLPFYVVGTIIAGISAGVTYPAKVLELYQKSKQQATTTPVSNIALPNIIPQVVNPLNDIVVPPTTTPIQPPFYKVKATQGARLRREPAIPQKPNDNKTVGTGGNIIRTLSVNTSVVLLDGDFITANNVTWAKVRLQGATPGNSSSEGWISTSLLTPTPQPYKLATAQPPAITNTTVTQPIVLGASGDAAFSKQFETELQQETGKPLVPDKIDTKRERLSELGQIPVQYKDIITVEVVRPVNGNPGVAAWKIAREVANYLKSTTLLSNSVKNDIVNIGGVEGEKTTLVAIFRARQEQIVAPPITNNGQQLLTEIYKPINNTVRFRENPSTSGKILKTLSTSTQLRLITQPASGTPTGTTTQLVQSSGYVWGNFEIIQTKEKGWIATNLVTPTVAGITPSSPTSAPAPTPTSAPAPTPTPSPVSAQPTPTTQPISIPQWLIQTVSFGSNGTLTNLVNVQNTLSTLSAPTLTQRYSEVDKLIVDLQRIQPNNVQRNGLLQVKNLINNELTKRQAPSQSTSRAQQGNRILIVGDSITAEFYNGQQTSTWAAQFKRKRKDLNVEILAIGGKRLTDWMKPELSKKLISGQKFDKIVIYGGVNDMFANTTPQQAINTLQQMVNEARQSGAQVVVVTGYDTQNDMNINKIPLTKYVKTPEGYTPLKNKYIEYQNLIRTRITGATIVPTIRLGELSDGVHPYGSKVTTLLNHIEPYI